MITNMNFTSFIRQCLKETSKIAQASFGKVSGTTKPGDNNQVLTQTDLKIGQTLIKRIERAFPSHNIIDEEAGVLNKGSEFTWVVDPIDGTSNFANGIPLYGTLLGLLHCNVPVAGGLALPAFSEIYIAAKNKGAFCNGKRVFVTKEKKLKNVLVAYGMDGHPENPAFTRAECKTLANIVLGIRNLRASNSVFDAAMVAKGKYGALLNRSSKVWDNVAQHVIIEEAGGVYTDFFGRKIDYSKAIARPEANFTFFGASPALHSRLLDIIRK